MDVATITSEQSHLWQLPLWRNPSSIVCDPPLRLLVTFLQGNNLDQYFAVQLIRNIAGVELSDGPDTLCSGSVGSAPPGHVVVAKQTSRLLNDLVCRRFSFKTQTVDGIDIGGG